MVNLTKLSLLSCVTVRNIGFPRFPAEVCHSFKKKTLSLLFTEGCAMSYMRLLRISCGVTRSAKRTPLTIVSRHITSKHTYSSDDNKSRLEKDDITDRIMEQVATDPNFLRDVIKRVRHGCEKDPKIIESTNILTDYFLQADSNNDGVVTKEEIKQWLRRSPAVTGEAVRYVPEHTDSNTQMSAETISSTQLRQHFIKIAVPFIGFGFLDNVIMIISGSEIESYFGLSLGISAMAAAGLGNTLSDIVGIQAGGAIEAMSEKFGIEDPDFTKEQLKSKFIRLFTLLASMLGITFGCLLGMFPLLFIDDKESDKNLRVIFNSVDTNNNGTLELKELDVLFDLLSKGKYIDNPGQARDFMRSCGFHEQDDLNFDEFKQLFNAYINKTVIDKQAHDKRAKRILLAAHP